MISDHRRYQQSLAADCAYPAAGGRNLSRESEDTVFVKTLTVSREHPPLAGQTFTSLRVRGSPACWCDVHQPAGVTFTSLLV
jgi:hypothetical protein